MSMSVGSVINLSNYPDLKIMNKQNYHKPEFRLYGSISVMTQALGSKGTSADNSKGLTKTS
jgi:hypothetical protein